MENRVINLNNGLEAFLISDQEANKSSFALDLMIGSLSDPKAHQGLAHLLEHMIFTGTSGSSTKNEFHEFKIRY